MRSREGEEREAFRGSRKGDRIGFELHVRVLPGGKVARPLWFC